MKQREFKPSNDNKGAASHYKFDSSPIDSRVITYKADDLTTPVKIEDFRPKGMRETQSGMNAKSSIERDDRKLRLDLAVSNKKVCSIEQAATYLMVTTHTAKRYLRELGITLPDN